MARWTTRDIGDDTAGAERLFRMAALQVQARRKRKPERVYWEDPVAWLHDRVTFPEGEHPTAYQEELLGAIATHKRASARGPHGLGKTAIGAWALLWFVDTRDRAKADWKAITTAGSWGQLRNFFWPEVRAANLVVSLGGSLSGEHGDELLRRTATTEQGNLAPLRRRATAVSRRAPRPCPRPPAVDAAQPRAHTCSRSG